MRLAVLTGLYVDAPTRREGWVNARITVACGLGASALLAIIDNAFGARLRGRAHDGIRVPATNAVTVPLDSIVFHSIAFGTLCFLRARIQAKYAATLLVGLPLVLGCRRLVRQDEPNIVAAQA